MRHAAVVAGHYVEKGPTEEFEQNADKERRGQRMFHWPLEFPEVIVKRGGFDAFVGNPPFSAGAWLESSLGTSYRKHIVSHIVNDVTGLRGTADLCVYFMHRVVSLIRQSGFAGLILTNTVSEGDSRAVGLLQLASQGIEFYRANPSAKWPGTATLEVVMLWITTSSFKGELALGGRPVAHISPSLTEQDEPLDEPVELAANKPLICKGYELQGDGFKISWDVAQQIVSEDAKCAEVIFPLLTGDDLNNTPGCLPSCQVISFASRGLSKATQFRRPFEIVEREVKPHRLEYQGSTGRDKYLRTYWWLFRGHRKEVEDFSLTHARILVRSVVSKYSLFVFVDSTVVCTASMYCFLVDSDHLFACLQSSFHEAWSREYGSTLRVDLRYIAGRCFKTFPFAESSSATVESGLEYHERRKSLAST